MKKCLTLSICWMLMILQISAGDHPIKLSELIQAARQNDYLHQMIIAEKQKMDLQQGKAVSSYFPTVDLNASYKYQSMLPEIVISLPGFAIPPMEMGVKDQYDMNLQINQLIFDGFIRHYNQKLYDNLSNQESYKQQHRVKEVAQLIVQLAYQHQLLQISQQSLVSSQERLKINLKRVKLFYGQGFKSALDTLEITGKINDLQLKQVELNSSEKQLLIQLKRLTILTDFNKITIPEKLLVIHPVSEIRDFEPLLASNYQVQLTGFQRNHLNHLKEIHRSSFYPQIYGFGSYHYGKPGINFLGDTWENYWIAGISLKFNVWNWNKDRKQLQIDQLNLKQLAFRKQEIERNKRIQISQMIQQLSGLEQQLVIAGNNLAEKKQKYTLTTDQWQAGQKSTIDVLSAEQELTGADLRVKQITFQYLSLYQRTLFELNQFEWE